MNKIPYIRSVSIIMILTVLIMLLPSMNNMMKEAELKNKKTPWTYNGQSYKNNITAKELAGLYTKRGFENYAMLSFNESYDYKAEEVAEMLEKALNDANLKWICEYLIPLAKEDQISYFSKNRILMPIDGKIVALSISNIVFFDAGYITFEEKSSLLLECSLLTDKEIDAADAIAQNFYTYYSDTLGLPEFLFSIDLWGEADRQTRLTAELRQVETDDTFIED